MNKKLNKKLKIDRQTVRVLGDVSRVLGAGACSIGAPSNHGCTPGCPTGKPSCRDQTCGCDITEGETGTTTF